MAIPRQHVGPATTLLSLIVALAAAAVIGLAWDGIRLPYDNPAGIVGPLSRIGFHPANNILRFLLFVAIPVGLALLPLRMAAAPAGPRRAASAELRPALVAAVTGLIALWGVFRGASELLAGWVPPPDLFHFGELLTPARTWVEGGGLWSGSFFAHGAFYDVFSTAAGWWLTGDESHVGPVVVRALMRSLWVAGWAALALAIFRSVRRDAGDASAALLAGSAVIGVHVAQEYRELLSARDVLLLAGLAVVVLAAASRRSATWALAGLLIPVAFLFSIDRGAYLAATAAVVLLVAGRGPGGAGPRALMAFTLGLGGGAFAWVVVFGWTETRAFAENLVFWVRFKDYLDSYVFPSPLDRSNPLHAAVLWTALLALWMLVYAERSADGHQGPRVRAVHVALTLAGLLLLRNALGRSDPGHLRYSISLILLSFGFGAWRLLAPRLGRMSVMAPLAVSLLGALTLGEIVRTGFELRRFIHSELPPWQALSQGELEYLPAVARRAAPGLRDAFDSQPCLFVLPSEPAWYFHLRKKPCSRFYITWFAAPAAHQREVIRTLEARRPSRILFSSPLPTDAIDGISSEERYPVLFPWLRSRYRYLDSFEGFEVYEMRPAAFPDPGG